MVLTEDTDSFIIGDRVWVGGTKAGQIAYIGETQFAPGDWAGIVLDDTIGKFKILQSNLRNWDTSHLTRFNCIIIKFFIYTIFFNNKNKQYFFK